MRAAAITISTSRAAGAGARDGGPVPADESGPALESLARALGAHTVVRETIADDRTSIERLLCKLADEERCALVLTSGGTGVAPDDITPEATRAVIEREIPGIGEAMRLASRPHTPHWMLSRATAGVRGAALIVNLPGSPRAIAQVGETLTPALTHALALVGLHTTHH